jgi:hypothetical protein
MANLITALHQIYIRSYQQEVVAIITIIPILPTELNEIFVRPSVLALHVVLRFNL